MRKIFLLLAAGAMLIACDNLKSKTSKDADDEETTLKKKKPLTDDEDTGGNEDENDTKSKRRTSSNDKDEIEDEDATGDRDMTDDNEGTEDGWPAAEKRTFMSNCVSGATATFGARGAKNYCACMLEKIEDRYPNPLDAARLTQSDMEPLAKDCVDQ